MDVLRNGGLQREAQQEVSLFGGSPMDCWVSKLDQTAGIWALNGSSCRAFKVQAVKADVRREADRALQLHTALGLPRSFGRSTLHLVASRLDFGPRTILDMIQGASWLTKTLGPGPHNCPGNLDLHLACLCLPRPPNAWLSATRPF